MEFKENRMRNTQTHTLPYFHYKNDKYIKQT